MLDAMVIESQSLPAELLGAYRNPPGRKPNESVLRIRDALVNTDDATALLLLRDVVDAAVFQMVYLLGAGFKSNLSVDISRDGNRERLDDSALHEEYRARVEPGGIRCD
ncbi:hypothetical protein C0V72_12510 [Porphyrobacter sp. TH134]|nr:hypothetical protein C0V72_12510 [Porphyrobacter sp. TH134]